MHLKDLLGSFVRVGYRIPVPDFYLVLHGLRCRKSTIMDKTKLTQLKFGIEKTVITLQYKYSFGKTAEVNVDREDVK